MSTTHDRFDNRPVVKTKRLNVLPSNPEGLSRGRFPSWLHRPLPKGGAMAHTGAAVRSQHLHTVCEEAKCPNRFECWSRGTATFLILGKECTRSCGFCSIATSSTPPPPSPEEPEQVALSAQQLALRHVVVTMVARDDLADGGASHLAATVAAIRRQLPTATIEVLTSDFAGNTASWDVVLAARPDIFNHNIETVRNLTPRVRHRATYDRTLALLHYLHTHRPSSKMLVKSGLMAGLGETDAEVHSTLDDLHSAGCDIVTIGQYLQSHPRKLLVKAFVPPPQFDAYASYGHSIGIPHMYCGPFVRSSYNADLFIGV